MNETLKEELRQEYLEELRKEPFHQWLEDWRSELEEDFLNTLPPEDVPLDDELPDFMRDMEGEFNDWAYKVYLENEE